MKPKGLDGPRGPPPVLQCCDTATSAQPKVGGAMRRWSRRAPFHIRNQPKR